MRITTLLPLIAARLSWGLAGSSDGEFDDKSDLLAGKILPRQSGDLPLAIVKKKTFINEKDNIRPVLVVLEIICDTPVCYIGKNSIGGQDGGVIEVQVPEKSIGVPFTTTIEQTAYQTVHTATTTVVANATPTGANKLKARNLPQASIIRQSLVHRRDDFVQLPVKIEIVALCETNQCSLNPLGAAPGAEFEIHLPDKQVGVPFTTQIVADSTFIKTAYAATDYVTVTAPPATGTEDPGTTTTLTQTKTYLKVQGLRVSGQTVPTGSVEKRQDTSGESQIRYIGLVPVGDYYQIGVVDQTDLTHALPGLVDEDGRLHLYSGDLDVKVFVNPANLTVYSPMVAGSNMTGMIDKTFNIIDNSLSWLNAEFPQGFAVFFFIGEIMYNYFDAAALQSVPSEAEMVAIIPSPTAVVVSVVVKGGQTSVLATGTASNTAIISDARPYTNTTTAMVSTTGPNTTSGVTTGMS